LTRGKSLGGRSTLRVCLTPMSSEKLVRQAADQAHHEKEDLRTETHRLRHDADDKALTHHLQKMLVEKDLAHPEKEKDADDSAAVDDVEQDDCFSVAEIEDPWTFVLFDQACAHEGRAFADGEKIFLRTELLYQSPEPLQLSCTPSENKEGPCNPSKKVHQEEGSSIGGAPVRAVLHLAQAARELQCNTNMKNTSADTPAQELQQVGIENNILGETSSTSTQQEGQQRAVSSSSTGRSTMAGE
ncbi:unnamed protein product, partial [Amoebophrya sp. A25]